MHADGNGSLARGDRDPRTVLLVVQRPGGPFFRYAETRRASGSEPPHAGGTGSPGTRSEDDCGILAGQTVVVHEHLDGRMSIRYGPNVIAQYTPDEVPDQAPKRRGIPRLPKTKALPNQFGRRSFSELEARPPDLRDLTLLARTAG